MAKKSDPVIHVIELDLRDGRFQSGVLRYLDILRDHYPENIRTMRILGVFSPDIRDVRIESDGDDVVFSYPMGFPAASIFDAVFAFVAPRLASMKNIIVKSNCLGAEPLAYMIRARIYCRTMAVLHCLPTAGAPAMPGVDPLFNMDYVVSVCDAACSWLDQIKNTRPRVVIPNGIERPALRNRRKSDDVFRFIFPGGFAQHKGFAKIIPAIAQVAAQHKIEVTVVGGGAPDDAMRQQMANLPIKRLGLAKPADMDALYAMADAVLIASQSEACSFAGIEAMANNLPVVMTNAAGLCEMFGDAAMTVPMTDKFEIDTDAYARAMTQLITSSRTRMRLAVAGYARYLSRYTAKKMTAATVDLYRRLVAAGGPD